MTLPQSILRFIKYGSPPITAILFLAWMVSLHGSLEYRVNGLTIGICEGSFEFDRTPWWDGWSPAKTGLQWSSGMRPSYFTGVLNWPIRLHQFQYVPESAIADSPVVFVQEVQDGAGGWRSVDEHGEPLVFEPVTTPPDCIRCEPADVHYRDGRVKHVTDRRFGETGRLLSSQNSGLLGTFYTPDNQRYFDFVATESRSELGIKLWLLVLPFAITSVAAWRRPMVRFLFASPKRTSRGRIIGLTGITLGLTASFISLAVWIGSYVWDVTYERWSQACSGANVRIGTYTGAIFIHLTFLDVSLQGREVLRTLHSAYSDGELGGGVYSVSGISVGTSTVRGYPSPFVDFYQGSFPMRCNDDCKKLHGTACPLQGVMNRQVGIVIPCWLCLLTTLSLSCFLVRRYSPFPSHHCQKCGYDLRGNASGACPECGQTVSSRQRLRAEVTAPPPSSSISSKTN